MPEFITCHNCSAPNQEVGKFCEQCGSAIRQTDPAATADLGVEPAGTNRTADTPLTMRFIRLENGVFRRDQAFDVPRGSRLLVGRTDPGSGIFPEVDVTMWSKRVPTPEGALYTVHRKQCYITCDEHNRIWIRDDDSYMGDTMVSMVGTSHFRTIPSLQGERETTPEGDIALEVGDRILMGQGEGMLIFQLLKV